MLTYERAAAAMAAARNEAARLGVAANIAILDDGTHLKLFERMDGAVLGSIDVSIGKARTAALFGIPSEAVWDYCKPGAPAPGLERSNGGLMTFPGGVPLVDPTSAQAIGAIGVSGGSPDQDARIARAGALGT